MTPSQKYLVQILAQLRGLHWSHWNSHWRVKGDTAYGDHLLFERLYSAVTEEIDTLGEKIVSLYGQEALTDQETLLETQRFLNLYQVEDIYERAYRLEKHFQRSLKRAYEGIKEAGDMSLGVDDFLMGVANDHETPIYLLRQRLR